jgi:hypothetical protein
MFKRLLLGIVIGLVVGAGAAALLIKGLHVLAFGATGLGTMTAYVAALLTGAFVALVAGKPFWAKGAWIEVGLKAFFGSLLAAGGMFALRRWGLMHVPLPAGLSPADDPTAMIGYLPAVTMPVIATVLSMFFEIDNTEAPPEEATSQKPAGKAQQVRVAASPSKRGSRVSKEEAVGEEEVAASKRLRS